MFKKNNSSRSSRVAIEIKRVLSDFFLRDCYFAEGVNSSSMCVTDVVISPCLQHAKVYVVSLSKSITNDDCIEFLKKHTPHLRHHIGAKIRLKYVPDLVFFIGNSFDYVNRIELLLNNNKSECMDSSSH
ncbi:MAG: 30S ribosome-binding factor RbfA [Holosporaceae bacterium]|jgi:ribosome-binding factor A|nr:30S ribosome-binding factor RbfA [Holosporaceae bacterium]